VLSRKDSPGKGAKRVLLQLRVQGFQVGGQLRLDPACGVVGQDFVGTRLDAVEGRQSDVARVGLGASRPDVMSVST
jgi:hypothetical protein